MKILLYGIQLNGFMFEWQRTHYIDEMLHYEVRFETINPLDYSSFDQANELLIKKINSGEYDVLFSTLCFPDYIYPETLKNAKQKGIPSISFRADNLSVPMRDKKIAPLFDLVWLTAKETEYLYKKWGANTIFLPYAANPYIFVPNNVMRNNGSICFIGTPHGSRPILVNALAEKNIPIDVYCLSDSNKQKSVNNVNYQAGNKWREIMRKMQFAEGRRIMIAEIKKKMVSQPGICKSDCIHLLPKLSFNDMISAYSDYNLSLSFTSYGNTDVLRKPLNIINLRNFEIPMSGGLQICRYNEELATYFEEGKEIIFYQSTDEYADKVKYYLNASSDKLIVKMKIAARKRAENEHTWYNRFSKVFNALGIQ